MEQWDNFKMPDLQAFVCVLSVGFVTIGISALFTSFIESKPSGRQTVIGKLEKFDWLVLLPYYSKDKPGN